MLHTSESLIGSPEQLSLGKRNLSSPAAGSFNREMFWVEPTPQDIPGPSTPPRLPEEFREPVFIDSETNQVEAAIIGFPTALNYGKINKINVHAKETLEGKSRIVLLEEAQHEFFMFRKALDMLGVRVFSPKAIAELWDQIYTRDIGIVVKDIIIPCRMNLPDRKSEPRALAALFAQINKQAEFGRLEVPPAKDQKGNRITYEGGDIFVHDGCIYIAESERTTRAAIEWFKRRFSDEMNIVDARLRPPEPGKQALHLDCAFNICGSEPTFVVNPNSFIGAEKFFHQLPKNAQFVSISDEEQKRLGSNFLSINPTTVILRDNCLETAEKLAKIGMTVILLPFDAAASMGGSFRCGSFVLRRSRARSNFNQSRSPTRNVGRIITFQQLVRENQLAS